MGSFCQHPGIFIAGYWRTEAFAVWTGSNLRLQTHPVIFAEMEKQLFTPLSYVSASFPEGDFVQIFPCMILDVFQVLVWVSFVSV